MTGRIFEVHAAQVIASTYLERNRVRVVGVPRDGHHLLQLPIVLLDSKNQQYIYLYYAGVEISRPNLSLSGAPTAQPLVASCSDVTFYDSR